MFSQNPQLIALKKTEQEVERKKLRDQALEEIQQKIKDHEMQRAHTSKGLEEIFSDPKEMGEFAEHTVKQYEHLKLFCRERNLEPDETLAGFIGSKEDYLRTAEEEGEVQDLPEYWFHYRLFSNESKGKRGGTAIGMQVLREYFRDKMSELRF